MTDPFAALFEPAEAVQPDAGFATRLRARVARALTIPEGVDVTTTTLEDRASTSAPTTTESSGAVGALTPYMAVADARAAIEWYGRVFGARVTYEPIVMPDGRIGHTELAIGTSKVMMAEAHPEIGVVAPDPDASSVSFHLEVADVDDVAERAVDAGARLDRAPADAFYGRSAIVTDPFGHRWQLMTSAPAAPARFPGGLRHGDVGHISYQVPDVDRAVAFYGAALGWSFRPAAPGHPARPVVDVAPMINVWPVSDRREAVSDGEVTPGVMATWRVDDLDAAIERVRAAGGQVAPVVDEPWGRMVQCRDDQGMRFGLWEPTADAKAEAASVSGAIRAASLNGARPGDISYLTLEVPDSIRARAFYSAVLGWSFRPARVADGWGVEDPMPMVGMAGGRPAAVAIPQFRVEDIHAAVERIRAAGGTSTDPEQFPYGWSAECTDDQGMRFYLGQMA